LEGTDISLWDCWGLTQKTYHGNELELILDGKLPGGWSMDDRIGQHAGILQKASATAANRKIHSILFFLPQAAVNDPSQEQTRKLLASNFQAMVRKGKCFEILLLFLFVCSFHWKFFEIISYDFVGSQQPFCTEYNPLVVLTRVDEVNRSIRTGASTTYPDLEQLRQKAANILNIEKFRVVLSVNYIDEEKRSFAIDRGVYKILEKAAAFGIQKAKLDKEAQEQPRATSSSSNSAERKWDF
jgi:hypothetical protein